MRITSTIDFMDYVFVYKGQENYYPLEEYEKMIRQLAEGGITKLNLRVNVSGMTFYPSNVAETYGSRNEFLWYNVPATMRFKETIKRYDACAETVRLGHKYGVEVWAWESLYDDAGICVDITQVPKEYLEAYHRMGGWGMLDAFYLEHPEALAARDPLLVAASSKEAQEVVHNKIRKDGIVELRIETAPEWDGSLKPPRMNNENLLIYTSDDNLGFALYSGPREVLSSQVKGRNYVVIRNLKLNQPYLKLLCTDTEGYCTMTIQRPEGQGCLLTRTGEKIPCGMAVNQGFLEESPVTFLSVRGAEAWDRKGNYLAIEAGHPALNKVLLGFAEFNVPIAMEHKVARFQELTKYGFDGFIFNTRSHSATNFGEQYGYNPEVLKKFFQRHGRVYSGTQEDKAAVFQIRAEGIADFFKQCKALTGGRPLFMSAPMPLEYKSDPNYNPHCGPMPWPYPRLFAEGTLDGVIMIGPNFENGTDFSEYFNESVTGGRPITIGIFREMFGQPKGYDFAEDLRKLKASSLDEVELYESAMLNYNPASFDFIRGTAPTGAKMHWTWRLS